MAQVYVLAGDRGAEGPRVQTDGLNFEGVWAHADLVRQRGESLPAFTCQRLKGCQCHTLCLIQWAMAHSTC